MLGLLDLGAVDPGWETQSSERPSEKLKSGILDAALDGKAMQQKQSQPVLQIIIVRLLMPEARTKTGCGAYRYPQKRVWQIDLIATRFWLRVPQTRLHVIAAPRSRLRCPSNTINTSNKIRADRCKIHGQCRPDLPDHILQALCYMLRYTF